MWTLFWIVAVYAAGFVTGVLVCAVLTTGRSEGD